MAEPTTKRVMAWLLAPAILFGLWACWGQGPTSIEPSSEASPRDPSSTPTTADETVDATTTEQRLPAADPTEGSPGGDDTADFDSLVEQLVEIALVASKSVEAGQTDGLSDLDEKGQAILLRIANEIEDPDYRALHKLSELPSEDTSIRGIVRRQLCVGILRKGLHRKLTSFEHGASRRRLDLLVRGILDSIPLDELLAQDLGKLLTGTKFLGVAHEAPVLDLCASAAKDQYLLPIVTGILETLWNNLRAEGARSPEELVHLALIFRVDANPAKRLVAMRYLLVADHGRYREFVLQEAIATRDEQLISELTVTAADKLAPKVAISAIERLSLVTKQPQTMAFMRLSQRDSKVILDAYEQKLADGTRPDFRAELITAAGFRNGADGLKLAQLAFANDPDPAVRTRAMFAITGNADSRTGEKTLEAALDDATFSADPSRLGSIVGALQNLASTGDHDAVDRIGKRLMKRTGLRAGDRRQLELILRRVLPSAPTFPPTMGRAKKKNGP